MINDTEKLCKLIYPYPLTELCSDNPQGKDNTLIKVICIADGNIEITWNI